MMSEFDEECMDAERLVPSLQRERTSWNGSRIAMKYSDIDAKMLQILTLRMHQMLFN